MRPQEDLGELSSDSYQNTEALLSIFLKDGISSPRMGENSDVKETRDLIYGKPNVSRRWERAAKNNYKVLTAWRQT